jgi:SAM-dependent methyltransferase
MPFSIRRTWSRLKGKAWRSYVKRRHIASLMDSVPRDAVILEIGGGYNPRYVKANYPNVHHLDHASTEDLRVKYASIESMRPYIDRIQPIDFVFDGRPIEQLIPPELRFDLIYGSHVLEHQVDLIGHLQSLEKLLIPGGRIIEMVPDLRATFDALRFPTVTSDALLVHQRPSAIHRGKQVFDAMAFEIDLNHGFRICDAELDGVAFARGLRAAHDAMLLAQKAGQAYTDTHAWTFTPESFRLLMVELRLLGLTGLTATFVSPSYGNQFCAVLQVAPDDADEPSPTTREALERERLALAKTLRLA